MGLRKAPSRLEAPCHSNGSAQATNAALQGLDCRDCRAVYIKEDYTISITTASHVQTQEAAAKCKAFNPMARSSGRLGRADLTCVAMLANLPLVRRHITVVRWRLSVLRSQILRTWHGLCPITEIDHLPCSSWGANHVQSRGRRRRAYNNCRTISCRLAALAGVSHEEPLSSDTRQPLSLCRLLILW